MHVKHLLLFFAHFGICVFELLYGNDKGCTYNKLILDVWCLDLNFGIFANWL